jgi:hypothetical protein
LRKFWKKNFSANSNNFANFLGKNSTRFRSQFIFLKIKIIKKKFIKKNSTLPVTKPWSDSETGRGPLPHTTRALDKT